MSILTLGVGAQTKQKPLIYPGKGHIDVEKLNKNLNLNMDLSQLSLSELRVLKSAIAARHGFCFKEAELRHTFDQTSWYDSLLMKAWEDDDANWEEMQTIPQNGYSEYDQPKIVYTPKEKAFLKRIHERMEQIEESIQTNAPSFRENYVNILNANQLDNADPELVKTLNKNGFAIVPAQHQQLFQLYEKNDYADFPSFVTTDLYLQLFHFYFDTTLKDIEEEKFTGLMTNFCKNLAAEIDAKGKDAKGKQKDIVSWSRIYAAIAYQLISGKEIQNKNLSSKEKKIIQEEVAKVLKSENDYSKFLGYTKVTFGYSLFRPRGHYTRSESVKRYFRGMMWLQTVGFGSDNEEQMKYCAFIANIIGKSEVLLKDYNKLFEPMTVLMGKPDNITMLQVNELMDKMGCTWETFVDNKDKLAEFLEQTTALAKKQTRINPKFVFTSKYKVNLMPQRYQPDAEVLNEMVDSINDPTKRDVPAALDVFAALGSNKAKDILLNERKEAEKWEGFSPTLARMEKRMKDIDWTETVCNRWLQSLKVLNDSIKKAEDNTPYFMLTPQWMKKNLNTALASYAEIKHDAILYAKQPEGAECGGGGPPAPIVKGYVEPNVPFWNKAVSLMYSFEDFLDKYNLWTDKVRSTTDRIKEEAEFLLRISKKEKKNDELSDEEYNQIEIIGSTFENISLELARSKDQQLDGWDDIQGADKNIACVADVYTANGPTNPNHSILFEAVAPADEIYVLVRFREGLYLMRGAVFSYREFKRDIKEQRLTDEEWQKMVKEKPRYGVPAWMKEIIAPVKNAPKDNEEVFYSSGC